MSAFFQKLIEVLKEFNLSTLACTLEKKLNQYVCMHGNSNSLLMISLYTYICQSPIQEEKLTCSHKNLKGLELQQGLGLRPWAVQS